MLVYKSFATQIKRVTPSGGDLDLINQIAIEEHEAEQLYVGRMALCNNQYDRSNERFPEGYLKRFADTLPGKGVLTGHNYRELPTGKFFDAEVRKSGADHLDLVPSYYLLADDPLVPKIKAGIVKAVSIGFEPDKRFCDIDGKDYDGWWNDIDDDDPCHHILGREYEIDGQKVIATATWGGDESKVEAVEGSFVWLGCQYGAETIGNSHRIGPEAKTAFFRERREKGLISVTREFGKSDKERGMSDKEKTEEKGGADPKEAALREAGEKYRARLLKNIETRYAACQMEATGKALSEGLKDASIDALEKAEADADKFFDERLKPKGAGTPDSAGDAAALEAARREFNPLSGREEEYL